ncbi:quinol:cytochrome c oxidoreductase quinone-binding subunit 2 [Pontibacter ummariensis]|uniref:Quinol:cytochrome c oxidoreductase quinone-binding subunit 2 n=1 Tax=Pontibacter ummariensis TaxID=1610492 RepID=A0A239KWS1_9BACT|nr:quinol:cytochrome C oxidoreductase [Pontibacter ummariensis]PRY04952.1 quinol:cytochrome c oxidoreductase quinone-binding subunit 2 [Pontibacter ummariensis]SNT22182.1 quinol:cytochrome c oxidoreductase quinone-binding subunit 2 [Pontibacter ummariensis]
MTEERLIISRKTNNKFFLMIAVGVVLLIAGIILMATGGGGEHHAEGGEQAAVEHAATWLDRLWVNLWLNNVYFTGIALIGVFFVAVNYVTYSGWYTLIKRVPEALGYFLPVGGVIMLLVFLFGSHTIFHWTHEYLYEIDDPRYDPIIAGKRPYLNTVFFLIRMVAYFALWIGLATWLRKNSVKEDLEGGTDYYHKNIRISAVFLVVFGVTSSTAAWDWVLSIDTHWFSTMFGWYVFSSWWVSGLAAVTLAVIFLKQNGYLKMVNANHLHDLGKFCFAFSIFWTYIWFSQFMLYWYANIPEEAIYFIERTNARGYDFNWIFFGNLFINFFFPFLVLMTRDAKRQMIMLKIVTIAILIGHWFDFYLMIMPGTLRGEASVGLMEIGTALVFLGVFLLMFTKGLTKAALVPVNHPFLEESVHHHV